MYIFIYNWFIQIFGYCIYRKNPQTQCVQNVTSIVRMKTSQCVQNDVETVAHVETRHIHFQTLCIGMGMVKSGSRFPFLVHVPILT